jgi:4'-phosphopantetheinyl transferase
VTDDPAVRLWIARFSHLDRPRWLARAAHLLNAAELARVAAVTDPDARAQHAVGRALIRLVGAGEAGSNPAELTVAVTDAGKPWLPGLPDLHVSVSHTRRIVVLAAMSGSPVGVDVEHPAAAVQPQRLAQRLFAGQEVHAMRRLAGDALDDWFASAWTIKEAVAKALGVGVVPALSSVVVDTGEDGLRLAEVGYGPPARSWTLHQLVAPAGRERIAVAVPAADVALAPVSHVTLAGFERAAGAQGATARTWPGSAFRRARA